MSADHMSTPDLETLAKSLLTDQPDCLRLIDEISERLPGVVTKHPGLAALVEETTQQLLAMRPVFERLGGYTVDTFVAECRSDQSFLNQMLLTTHKLSMVLLQWEPYDFAARGY